MNDTWDLFPMDVPRPVNTETTTSHRAILERRISKQTAFLLSHYGIDDAAPIFVGDCLTVEDAISYFILELEPIWLEDGTELRIGQQPRRNFDPEWRPGFHSITHLGEDGFPKLEITVEDPSHRKASPVYSHNGPLPRRLGMSMLQELNDVLTVETANLADIIPPNIQPYDTSAYPELISEPAFDALVAQIHDSHRFGDQTRPFDQRFFD